MVRSENLRPGAGCVRFPSLSGDGAALHRAGTVRGQGTPVSWIRAADEERERRPADAARCAIGVLGFAAAGIWSDAGKDVSVRLVSFFNGLPNALDGLANALVAVGSVWAVLVVALLLLVLRRVVPSLTALAAGLGALGVAALCHEIFGVHSVAGLSLDLRGGPGPMYPAAAVASVAAVGLTLSPYLVRPVRRMLVVLV